VSGRRLVRAAALLAVLGLIVAACGGGDDNDGAAGAESGEPQSGGHLDILLHAGASLATSLDPARLVYRAGGGGTSGAWYPWAIYGGLMVEDPVTGTVEPSMAESLETTDGGTTWELRLRDGVTFSDGNPLDADAVKFNWDRIADPATGASAQRSIALWESWTVTDPLTVTIVLEQANPQFPRVVAQSFSAIGSPTAITEMGDDFGAQPVGAGPFVVDGFQPGTSLEVSRNRRYFDAPQPYLDSITFRVISDEDQRLRSFEAREADLTIMLRGPDVARAEELDAHAVVTQAAFFSGFAMNTEEPPFDDERVRRAFLLATDRSIVCQARNPGSPCGEDGNVPVPDWPFPPDTPFHDPDVRFPDTDVAAAQELIDDYIDDGGSVDVTLTIVSGAQVALDIAQAQKSQLDQLEGVDVTIEQAGADFGTNLVAGAYEMAAFSIPDAYPYPALHDWFRSGGTFNAVTGFTTSELDGVLDDALAAGDAEEAREAYSEMAQIVIDEALLIPYSYNQFGLVARNTVQDLTPMADQGVRWERLWLTSDE
jgi:peptide/nickel transport system substrate-binding protein